MNGPPRAPRTSEDLARLVGPFGSPRKLLQRATEAGLRITLASAWQAEGRPLGPVLGAEVALHRGRRDEYMQLLHRIRHRCPDAMVQRGPALAAYYPDGWMRPCRDLDVTVAGPAAVFAVAAGLGPELRPVDLRLAVGDDGPEVWLTLKGDTPDPLLLNRVRVDLFGRAGPDRSPEPEPARQWAALARREEPPGLPHVLDALLLLQQPGLLDRVRAATDSGSARLLAAAYSVAARMAPAHNAGARPTQPAPPVRAAGPAEPLDSRSWRRFAGQRYRGEVVDPARIHPGVDDWVHLPDGALAATTALGRVRWTSTG